MLSSLLQLTGPPFPHHPPSIEMQTLLSSALLKLKITYDITICMFVCFYLESNGIYFLYMI